MYQKDTSYMYVFLSKKCSQRGPKGYPKPSKIYQKSMSLRSWPPEAPKSDLEALLDRFLMDCGTLLVAKVVPKIKIWEYICSDVELCFSLPCYAL